MRAESILFSIKLGRCCPASGFHIDPPAPVEGARITRDCGGHACGRHGAGKATAETSQIMRLVAEFAGATQVTNGPLRIGGVTIGVHPAARAVRASPDAELCRAAP